MPLFNDKALLLRHWDLGESDKILSLFGRRYGKLRIVAKGCKKLKSRFAGRVEPLHLIDITYFGKENSSLFKLSAVDIANANSLIKEDLDKYFCANYILEMIESGMREGDPNPKAFDMVVKTFEWLEKESGDFEWLTRFFDVKFLGALGYRPTLHACVACRKEWTGATEPSFHPASGGLLCSTCGKTKTGLRTLSKGAAKFLGQISGATFEKGQRLKPTKEMLNEISGSIVAFRNANMQSKFNTERFLSTCGTAAR